MTRRTVSAALACLFAASAPTLHAQAGGEALAYRVPATPNVTYHAVDTLAQTFNAPGAAATYILSMALTLATTFEDDPGGVRVTGDIEALSATMAGPMGTPQTLPLDVTGAYVFIMGPRGSVEAISSPEFPAQLQAVTPLGSFHYEWFPRLPGASVQPGENWVDTVAWSHEGPQGRSSSSTVFSYTLVGDTLVAGRSFRKISIAGEAELTSEMEQNGADMETALAGSNAGHALWDRERGLLHSVEVAFDYRGTMNTPMGELPVSVTGSSRRRLEN